jgi:hypothetical protein
MVQQTFEAYLYAMDDPVNSTDPSGMDPPVIARVATNSQIPGIRARVDVIGRSQKDRAAGYVRIRFQIKLIGIITDLDVNYMEVGMYAKGYEPRYDRASPWDPVNPQSRAHTSLALKPGTSYSVLGIVHTFAFGGSSITYIGSFVAPPESVYDGRNIPDRYLPGYTDDTADA